MEKLVDLAKSNFELIGETLVVATWLALLIVGFGLFLFFVGGICVAIYEWIKERLKND